MADESVELEIELKDGISGPSKRASRALQKLAEDAERAQTRMMRKISMASVKSHKMRLGREVSAFKQSALLGKRSQRMREAEGMGWSKLAGGIGVAGGALAAMAAVSAATVYGAYKLGSALVESAKHAGQLRFALGQLTHTDGRAELEGITKLAYDFGLNVESTAHSYERLLKMQFKPDEAKTWVKFGADMQALGNSAEEVEGILLAVSQIKSKGRLQAQEMLQLAERGVSSDLVYSAIERKTGKSRQEVMKLQEAGGIDSEMGMAAIQEALLQKLNTKAAGEAGAAYVKTFAGSMAKSDSFLQRVSLGLGASFERGFAGGDSGGISVFLDSMQNSATLQQIGGFVERLGNAFSVLAPYVMEVADAFITGFSDGAGLEDAMNPDTVRTFAIILRDDIVPAVQTVGSVIGWVSTKILQMTGLAVAGAAYWTNFFTGIKEGAESLVTSFTDLGSRVIDGFAAGLDAGFDRTKAAVTGWADGAVNFAKGAFGIHSPSKEFAALGKYSAQGFQMGLDTMTPQLPSADAMVPSSIGGGGSPVSMQIEINVSGTTDPQETARMVRIEFESMLSASFGRFAEGVA
jgi:tape measure domain-containing protein